MTGAELADHIRRAMGGVPPMRAREPLLILSRGEVDSIYIRYDEIKHWLPFDWVLRQPDVHMYDGEIGFTLRLGDG